MFVNPPALLPGEGLSSKLPPNCRRSRDIRMIQDAGQSAAQLIGVGSNRVSASLSMRERDYAMNPRRQFTRTEALRDLLCCVGRAVARCDHSNIVPCARPSILASIP